MNRISLDYQTVKKESIQIMKSQVRKRKKKKTMMIVILRKAKRKVKVKEMKSSVKRDFHGMN